MNVNKKINCKVIVKMEKRLHTYKIVVIGDAQSGKSSLLYRFVHRHFNTHSSSTVCAAFYSKIISSGHRVNMWDTAGQERFRSILPMYLKNIDLIIYVYDTTCKKSFDHLKDYWVKWSKENATTSRVDGNGELLPYGTIMVGNKTDLTSVKQVSTEEGSEYAKKMGIPFVETSVLNGTHVDQVWKLIESQLIALTNKSETTASHNNITQLIVEDNDVSHARGGLFSGCFGGGGSSSCNIM
jgi:small GTP-binding protein